MKKKDSINFTFRVIRFGMKFLELVAPSLAARIALSMFLRPFRFNPSAKDLQILEQAEHGTLQYENSELETFSWGNGTKTILIMHGWSGRIIQFREFIKAFVDKGYKVIGFNAPGHGNAKQKSSSILEFTKAIDLFLKQYQKPIDIVVGHSFGSSVLLFAEHHLGLKVKKRVLISVPANGDLVLKVFGQKINVSEKILKKIDQRVEKLVGNSFEYFTGEYNGKLVNNIPTLLIHDKDDTEAPIEHLDYLKASMPYAECYVTNGLNHVRILRNSNVVEKCVGFIESK